MNDPICVILAGGKGERLYPITKTRPKPLCPIGNVSCLERCIFRLRQAGFEDITVTSCYMADMIKQAVSGYGNIKVIAEEKPLGTAGAVKHAVGNTSRNVLVLSGDGVNDFDISNAVKLHESSSACCTIVATTTPYPTEYGVIREKNGCITGFSEKPSWKNVTSDRINTGIYVLSPKAVSLIPEKTEFDFSKDLFPLLMKLELKIAVCNIDGYWCDIGNPKAYYDCSMAFSGGKSTVSPSAFVDKEASVNASVIMENCVIGKKAVVDSSIICENVAIGEGSLIPSGCIVGGNSVIGKNVILSKGVTVAENSSIKDGEKITRNVVFGASKKKLFDSDNGVGGIYGKTFTVSDGVALGRALGEYAVKNGKSGKIGVMRKSLPQSELIASAIMTGIRYSGGEVYEFGNGYAALCGFCIDEYGLDFSLMTEYENGSINISIYGNKGRLIDEKTAYALEKLYYSESEASNSITPERKPESFDAPIYVFTNRLFSVAKELNGIECGVNAENITGNILYSVINELGGKAFKKKSGVDYIEISDGGSEIRVKTKGGRLFEKWQLLCYYLGEEATYKPVIYVPEETPVTVVGYASSKGTKVLRAEKENSFKDTDLAYRDCVYLAVSVLGILNKRGISFDAIGDIIPFFSVREFVSEYDESKKAAKTKELCDRCNRDDGAYFAYENGNIRFSPSSPKGFKIIAEASSFEYADELCDIARSMLDGKA